MMPRRRGSRIGLLALLRQLALSDEGSKNRIRRRRRRKKEREEEEEKAKDKSNKSKNGNKKKKTELNKELRGSLNSLSTPDTHTRAFSPDNDRAVGAGGGGERKSRSR